MEMYLFVHKDLFRNVNSGRDFVSRRDFHQCTRSQFIDPVFANTGLLALADRFTYWESFLLARTGSGFIHPLEN
jgi:hypothetical protein